MDKAVASTNVQGIYYCLSMMLKKDDEAIVVSQRSVFRNLIDQIFNGQNMGIRVIFASSISEVEKNLTKNSKIVILEKT